MISMETVQTNDLMKKGVVVRVLVLPGHVDDAKNIIKYLYDTYKIDLSIKELLSRKKNYILTDDLYDKIQDLENNSDLNELIEEIEFNSAEEFDKNNMCIVLNSSEFDKFQEKKDYKEFQVIVYYSLLD